MEQVKIFAISGALRQGSFNRKFLKAAVRKIKNATVDLADLHEFDLPLYDGDVEARGLPEGVVRLKERIAASDALLLATPEYNHSVPGTFKNAIDWASRPPGNPFSSKVALIISASPGYFGGVRSQLHLRQVLMSLRVLVLPELITLAGADKAFDEAANLTDPRIDAQLQKGLDSLVSHALILKSKK